VKGIKQKLRILSRVREHEPVTARELAAEYDGWTKSAASSCLVRHHRLGHLERERRDTDERGPDPNEYTTVEEFSVPGVP